MANAANPMGVADSGAIQPDTVVGALVDASRNAQDLAQPSTTGGNPGGSPGNPGAPSGPTNPKGYLGGPGFPRG